MFKLRKRSMTSILLYVLIAVVIIFYLIMLAVSKANLPHAGARVGAVQNMLGLPIAIPFAFLILSWVGCILAIVLAASSIGSEYNWRTIRTTVVSSESRFKLLIAKLTSVAIFILIGMLVAVLVGIIMSLITTAIGGYKFDFSFFTGNYMWDQFLQFWRTFFVMIPYAMLSFLLAITGRSAMPGIAIGVGVFFTESVILVNIMWAAGGWVAKIPGYLLYANQQAIMSMANLPAGIGGGGSGGSNSIVQLPSTTHAFIILSIYTVIFTFLSFYLFKKRDVTG